jgi:two-component system LytT family response regulator
MIRCIAIDDEPLALQQTVSYIKRTPFLQLKAQCKSAANALDIVNSEDIDLMFVDINMPDITGLEFVKSLQNHIMIIFTTAYSEYAVEGFRLDALDYLLKPFSLADFSRAAAKANSLYELKQQAQRATDPAMPAPNDEPMATATAEVVMTSTEKPAVESAPEQEYISVKSDYKLSLIRLDEIVYIESEGEYVRIHLRDGQRITTLYRMKNMEAELPADRFMRIHRSYIIHLKAIRSYMRGRVYLSEEDYLPIGENYKENFQRYIGKTFKNL